MTNLPRGIRNNNPLNLRRSSNKWLGKSANPTDPAFEQFATMTLGVRAGILNLLNHIRAANRALTVPTLAWEITKWAPSSENNTAAYVEAVCKLSLLRPETILRVDDRDTITRLVRAMIYVENGRHIDFDIIQRAYTLASQS